MKETFELQRKKMVLEMYEAIQKMEAWEEKAKKQDKWLKWYIAVRYPLYLISLFAILAEPVIRQYVGNSPVIITLVSTCKGVVLGMSYGWFLQEVLEDRRRKYDTEWARFQAGASIKEIKKEAEEILAEELEHKN